MPPSRALRARRQAAFRASRLAWRQARRSTAGDQDSSGISSTPRERIHAPRSTWLVSHGQRNRQQQRQRHRRQPQQRVALRWPAPAPSRQPPAVMGASAGRRRPRLTPAASRGGDFQSSFRPVSATSTNSECASMRMGACSTASTVSAWRCPAGAAPPKAALLALEEHRHQAQHARHEQQAQRPDPQAAQCTGTACQLGRRCLVGHPQRGAQARKASHSGADR
jgi:hypothetical protein